MSSKTIQSILARSIVDVMFFEQLREDPAFALGEYFLDPVEYADFLALDFDRLRRLSALITKVQNNNLWQSFHATRLLLVHYGLESEVFSRYCCIHQQNRSTPSLSRRDKIKQFSDFLDAYLLEKSVSRYPGLSEVLRHESIVWEMQGESDDKSLRSTAVVDSPSPRQSVGHLVPKIRGKIRIEDYSYDPLQLASELKRDSFVGARLQPTELAYLADQDSNTFKIVALNCVSSCILQLVDGQRTILCIAECVSGILPSEQVCQFFLDGGTNGLFMLDRAPQQR